MGPFRSMRTLGAGAVIAVTAAASLDAAKPAPAPANLSCTITFDDTLSYTEPGSMTPQTVATAVQSDGRGAYVDGADAVQCYVNNQPGSGNYQNVFVNADSRSARFLWMPGQVALTPYSRGGYTSFENRQPGYFEITNIATVHTAGVTERRRIRVGVGYALDFTGGLMRGDSLDSSPTVAGSSSAWITPLTFNAAGDACSWKLRVFPYAAVEAGDTGPIAAPRYVALEEGASFKNRTRTADFTLPVSATVRIKSGVNGCS